MTCRPRGSDIDISPWDSMDHQQEVINSVFNIHKLIKNKQGQSENKEIPIKIMQKHQKIHQKMTNKIFFNKMCKFQMQKPHGEIKKSRLKTQKVYRQNKIQKEQSQLTKFLHKNDSNFMPSKEIQLQQMFPSYSLKRFNRNKTFYRQTGIKFIQNNSNLLSRSQFSDHQFSPGQKELNLTTIQITLKPRDMKSKQKNKRDHIKTKEKQLSKEFHNIFLKNEERFRRTIISNKDRREIRFITVFNKQKNEEHPRKYEQKAEISIINEDKVKKEIFVSRSCLERSQRFSEMIEQIRCRKESSSLKKQKLFFTRECDFIQSKINTSLLLPKIQIIEIIQPSK